MIRIMKDCCHGRLRLLFGANKTRGAIGRKIVTCMGACGGPQNDTVDGLVVIVTFVFCYTAGAVHRP